MRGEDVAERLFQRLDADRDGVLSRDEMQATVDQTNKAARAQGIAEVDLFPFLDANKDGTLSRDEAEAYFRREMQRGESPRKKRQESPHTGGSDAVASMLLKKLDADGDGMLSREEMASVLSATNAQAEQRGEAAGDFFSTMDTDTNGKIDQYEAVAFFQEMEKAGLLGKGDASTLKDEV
jgi:Ca2+-binding EF-hand superfamily protein